MYVTYDKYDQKKLAEQIAACFNLGVVGERIPQHILDSRAKCVKDIYAMEQTKVIFMDKQDNRSIHRELDERIKQYRIWLKHWDKCFAEHKRGADKKATATQGFNLAFIASCMVAEETAASVQPVKPTLKAKKPEQKPDKKPGEKMIAVQPVKEEAKAVPKQEPKPRRFFQEAKKKKAKVDDEQA